MSDPITQQPVVVGSSRPVHDAKSSGSRTLAETEEAARQFESVFLSKMLEGMSTGLSGSVLSGGQAEDTWRSFMNDEYAKLISRSGGVGVADAVMKAMIGVQEIG
jgi:flagellar protein FlgJ